MNIDAWLSGEEGTRAVEAMARADHERTREVAGRYVKPWPAWEALDPMEREAACDAARVMLRAALSLTTTCATCGGRGKVTGDDDTDLWLNCPDCEGGTVPGEPALLGALAERVEGNVGEWIRSSSSLAGGWFEPAAESLYRLRPLEKEDET